MTPEGKVKAKVVRLLNKYKAWYCFPATHGYGKPGVPDIIGTHEGWFFGVEVKRTSKQHPTPPQALQLELIKDSGGMAMVIHCDNLCQLESWLIRNRFEQ